MINFDPLTKKHLKMWLDGPVDEETKTEICRRIQSDPKEILDAFYTMLSFGTGGMRGLMGAGTNRMNSYTIRIATQGLANYLLKHTTSKDTLSVFIGYDSRHHSETFAKEAAMVLAANQIKVFLSEELRPTPLISFGCRYKKCDSAIMITASHNPASYNGFKVFWNDGGQIVPPHDRGIFEEVKLITDFSLVRKTENLDHPLIERVGEEIDAAYIKAISGYPNYPRENQKMGADLKIIYTSLHGTGMTLLPQTLKSWGFSTIHFVGNQCNPDGKFPTVKRPNPEEPEALSLGIKTLQERDGDILIATDPDADRVGLVVMHQGKPIILNGNQIACIALYHLCEALTTQNRMPKNAAFIKTIATTELFKKIAVSYGGQCIDVLTGFKYVGERISEWEQSKGRHYIFGAEESFGYLLGSHARDKDAVIASALLCEAALHSKQKGKTLVDILNEIYEKFGVYYEEMATLEFEESKSGREQMVKGMEMLRSNPPKSIANVPVVIFEDYFASCRTSFSNGEMTTLNLPKNEAYLFWLEDETKVLIRPSGTEPKIKIYCGVVEKDKRKYLHALEKCKSKASEYLKWVNGFFKIGV